MNSSNSFEIVLSRDNIVSQVGALLYAVGKVDHNQDITNIQFNDLFGMSETELVKCKVFTQPKEHHA